MKNLTIIVVNGLKKALAWYTSKRNSADVKNAQDFSQLEKKATTANDNSPLDIKLRQVATGIKMLMDDQKMYKNPHLALRELSNGLNTPSYIVTKALNEVLGVNFYDLVNKYRVEEAKQLLINPRYDRFTILRVASDAGFNSKTTFNAVFRKFTGVTPSYYRTTCRITLDVPSHDLVTHS
jgi:AraC-like DNA-binding protein